MSSQNVPSSITENYAQLQIYVNEAIIFQNTPLFQHLFNEGLRLEIAGCTALRAFEGYGTQSPLHSELELEGSAPLDIRMEFIDTATNLEKFQKHLSAIIKKTFVIEKAVKVHSPIKNAGHSFDQKKDLHKRKDDMKNNDQKNSNPQSLLRIFIKESDTAGHVPLHEALLKLAEEQNLSGGTALRGIAGFGRSRVLHRSKLFQFSSKLPIIIEIVDSELKLQEFLQAAQHLLQNVLVTEEKVHVHHF